MDESTLVSDFFGSDVLLGDRALKTAIARGADDALRLLVPGKGGPGSGSIQVERRLAKLAGACGEGAVAHLVPIVRKTSAVAPAFAGLRQFEDRAASRLVDILKDGDINEQRNAIEALGFLGADGWAFSIAEFAQHGRWLPQDTGKPSRYELEKFHHFVVQALIRMTEPLTSVDSIARCLRTFRDFVPVCDETLGKGRVSDWDVRFVQHHFPSRAADPLVDTWIASDSPFLQDCAVEALGHLRLNRTSATLMDVLQSSRFDDRVRRSAGISLSQFADAGVATQFARHLDRLSASPGFSWAFASLYALGAAWPSCDDLIEGILGEGEASEVWMHMIHSLACRNDRRAEQCFSSLNSRLGHVRACSALACARLDPHKARDALRGRDEEASDPMELACILAAQVHAGELHRIDDLHHALTTFPQLRLLRITWKREVLHAFFAAEGNGSERGRLWCEAATESPDRVITEMQDLRRPRATADQAAPPVVVPVRKPEAAQKFDVFISHASEDKARIAQPLRDALVSAGVRVWFDKTELKLGDRLRRKIEDGLAHCRYGIVILSPNFLAKEWPRNELDGLMARETVFGTKAILPIWHDLGAEELVSAAPMLADRIACRSSEGVDTIVKMILDALKD